MSDTKYYKKYKKYKKKYLELKPKMKGAGGKTVKVNNIRDEQFRHLPNIPTNTPDIARSETVIKPPSVTEKPLENNYVKGIDGVIRDINVRKTSWGATLPPKEIYIPPEEIERRRKLGKNITNNRKWKYSIPGVDREKIEMELIEEERNKKMLLIRNTSQELEKARQRELVEKKRYLEMKRKARQREKAIRSEKNEDDDLSVNISVIMEEEEDEELDFLE